MTVTLYYCCINILPLRPRCCITLGSIEAFNLPHYLSNKMNHNTGHWPLDAPELLSETICHIDKGSLLSLALTCQSVSVPALSTLWQRQSHIIPLIKCLPHVINSSKRLVSCNLIHLICHMSLLKG